MLFSAFKAAEMDWQAEMENLTRAAERVVCAAARRGYTICTAESCTAGLVAAALGGVPGASAVLRGGAVTYCDEVKHKLLGVSERSLDRFSAVSRQVALEMATQAAARLDADIAVSLTGYAGPGGGTAQDPAGTVYVALWERGHCSVERCSFTGGRNEVRAAAAGRALALFLAAIEG